jgi:hypothetical protein
MRRVLLDTNGYSTLAQGDKAVLDALSEADAVYMSAVVLGELLALAGVLVHNRQPLQLATARCPVEHEVPAPHVIRSLRPPSVTAIDARAQATLLPLLYRHFQPLPLPQTKHARQANMPALAPRKPSDPSIPIPRLRP